MTPALHRLIALVSVLMTALAARAQPITAEQKDEVLASLGEIVTERAFVPGVHMGQWPDFVERHREMIDRAEQHETFTRAVNRALRDFGFSHLRMRSPAATQQRDSNSTSGLGIMTSHEDDRLIVVDLLPNGPAAEAGLQPGDEIIEVDGRRPESPSELRGPEGTEVTLKVTRTDGEVSELRVTRRVFSNARPDTLTWADDDTAVLRVHTFSKGYDRDLIERLVSEAAGAGYLILDLRGNGGGAPANLRHLLSRLLPADSVVGTFVSRRAAREFVRGEHGDGSDAVEIARWWRHKFRTTSDNPAFGGRMAVLVNRGSASASEIAAAALRELAGAPLVGQPTAGAVLVSEHRKLPHGFSVQYPTNDYVTIRGVRLEKNPLEPDVAPPSTRRGTPDPAVGAAIEVLKGERPLEADETGEQAEAERVSMAALRLVRAAA